MPDRLLGGRSFELLPLLARTTTTVTPTLAVPMWARGGFIVFNVTELSLTPSITPILLFQDPVTGTNISDSAAAITAVGSFIYAFGVNPPAAAEDVDDVLNMGPAIGCARLSGVITHADSDSITYQIGVLLHP